jgi:ribose-phosphate pyrophosphokinase
MYLFAGSSHPGLAAALAKELKVSVGKMTKKAFSCGERYVKFDESIRGKEVYILQTGTENANEDLIELFLMCQAARLSFASCIHVIIPHFPYARQDRVASPREPISAKLIAHLLEESGADHVVTLDLHSPQIQGFFSIPADSLSALPLLVNYFKKKKLVDPVIVAPDIGGAKGAKKFADLMGAELAIFHKSRPEHQEVEILEVVGDVEGKTCIIYDDMIDTAGTLVTAKKALADRGAGTEIYAAATHPIFSGPASERLNSAGFKEIVVTDSVPVKEGKIQNLTVIPIAEYLAEVIRHIEKGESVTEI